MAERALSMAPIDAIRLTRQEPNQEWNGIGG
jgi:hypothetical protein